MHYNLSTKKNIADVMTSSNKKSRINLMKLEWWDGDTWPVTDEFVDFISSSRNNIYLLYICLVL